MKVDYTLSHNLNVFLGIIADPLLYQMNVSD